jgi:hypothetical protein
MTGSGFHRQKTAEPTKSTTGAAMIVASMTTTNPIRRARARAISAPCPPGDIK